MINVFKLIGQLDSKIELLKSGPSSLQGRRPGGGAYVI